jgi:hypothetical protein
MGFAQATLMGLLVIDFSEEPIVRFSRCDVRFPPPNSSRRFATISG